MTINVAAFIAALLGSGVESVEALTVVLAVGLSVGWRPALRAAAFGVVTVIVLAAVAGGLLTRVPTAQLHLGVGIVLVLFGMRWLEKAVLRASGAMALRDESAKFAEAESAVRARGAGAALAYQSVVIEGLEIVVIVAGIGAGGAGFIWPAAGAIVAALLVSAAGFALRAPLARVPENGLKLAVGITICSLGTFWAGEGLGVAWPGDIASVLLIAVVFAGAAFVAGGVARSKGVRAPSAVTQ